MILIYVCLAILAIIVYIVFGFWIMLIESDYRTSFKSLHQLMVEHKMNWMIKNDPQQYNKDINGNYWRIYQGLLNNSYSWQSMYEDQNVKKFIETLDIVVLIFWPIFIMIDGVRYTKNELDSSKL